MAAVRKNLLVDLYTSFNLPVLHRDSNGNPVDLTGKTVVFRLSKAGSDEFIDGVNLTDLDDSGEFTVHFDDVEWPEGKHAYTLDIREGDTNTTGLLWGTLTVRDRSDV